MFVPIQLKFSTAPLSVLLLASMLFLLPHNTMAITLTGNTTIPSTGQTDIGCSGCNPNSDVNYGLANPTTGQEQAGGSYSLYYTGSDLQKINNNIISGTSPGFLTLTNGPYWIAPLGDVQNGNGVQNWGVEFDVNSTDYATLGGEVTVSGSLAAEGTVYASIDGFGNASTPVAASLTNPTMAQFSVSYTLNSLNANNVSVNYLDFSFTGCTTTPVGPCLDGDGPVYALLTDPSWGAVLPGTILASTPESVLDSDLANGVTVPPPSSVTEPSTMLLLGSGLIGFIAFRKQLGNVVS